MTKVYEELSKKLGLEDSLLIPHIWQAICTEEEARVINATPASAAELAHQFGRNIKEMELLLEKLFYRGVIFEQKKEGKTIYRMPRHIIQFHDASILWPEAPPELFNLWARYMEEEYPRIPAFLTKTESPPFLRVIPIEESVQATSQVLPYEDAARIVEEAARLSVTKCPCRMIARKCDKPLEVCLQLNRGAEYMIKRGIGREINANEAKEILRKSAAAGLVHMVENREGIGNVICNCCNCCCVGLSFAKNSATRGVVKASRYQASLTKEDCNSCGQCDNTCPVEVITLDANSFPHFEIEKCLGCGLCASVCPTGAITLIIGDTNYSQRSGVV